MMNICFNIQLLAIVRSANIIKEVKANSKMKGKQSNKVNRNQKYFGKLQATMKSYLSLFKSLRITEKTSIEANEANIHRLERTSSRNLVNSCEHCSHQHARKCCLYVHDDESDIHKYAVFKAALDEPYLVESTAEDFDMRIMRTTPSHFPMSTDNNPDRLEMEMMIEQAPLVQLRYIAIMRRLIVQGDNEERSQRCTKPSRITEIRCFVPV